jgi:hypothetical protein
VNFANQQLNSKPSKPMNLFLKIILGVAAVLGVLALIVATRPAEFVIRRQSVINASPEAVFAQVNNLKAWEAWSPWARLDPNMKQTYSGPAAGEGASTHWIGSPKVGEGRMTIVESRGMERVRINLEFLKPFAASNVAEFTLRPVSATDTEVTWTMSGKNNFLAKTIGLCMNMDKMVGGQFEEGLKNLNSAVTASNKGEKQYGLR